MPEEIFAVFLRGVFWVQKRFIHSIFDSKNKKVAKKTIAAGASAKSSN
jgi:hypothetical protein